MKKRKQEEILSVNERANLQAEKRDLENQLKEMDREKWGAGTSRSVDRSKVRKDIRRIEMALIGGSPKRMTGKTKDNYVKKAKQLEEKIKEGMPTTDEMLRPHKHPGAIRKQFEWEKRNGKAIREWKNIRRRLEPSDPTVSNVERLRRR